jgi:hypothetical protein
MNITSLLNPTSHMSREEEDGAGHGLLYYGEAVRFVKHDGDVETSQRPTNGGERERTVSNQPLLTHYPEGRELIDRASPSFSVHGKSDSDSRSSISSFLSNTISTTATSPTVECEDIPLPLSPTLGPLRLHQVRPLQLNRPNAVSVTSQPGHFRHVDYPSPQQSDCSPMITTPQRESARYSNHLRDYSYSNTSSPVSHHSATNYVFPPSPRDSLSTLASVATSRRPERALFEEHSFNGRRHVRTDSTNSHYSITEYSPRSSDDFGGYLRDCNPITPNVPSSARSAPRFLGEESQDSLSAKTTPRPFGVGNQYRYSE